MPQMNPKEVFHNTAQPVTPFKATFFQTIKKKNRIAIKIDTMTEKIKHDHNATTLPKFYIPWFDSTNWTLYIRKLLNSF